MNDVIKKAKKLADEQIKKYGHPSKMHTEYLLDTALKLSKKFKKTDKNLIKLGVYLMDTRLGKCLAENKLKNHAKEGAEVAELFLIKNGVNKETIEKVVNCVEAHHGKVPFKTLEAEIIANADCYPFINPKGFFEKFHTHAIKGDSFEQCLSFLNDKLDEKWNILSLDICKKELEEYYHAFKKLVAVARQ